LYAIKHDLPVYRTDVRPNSVKSRIVLVSKKMSRIMVVIEISAKERSNTHERWNTTSC